MSTKKEQLENQFMHKRYIMKKAEDWFGRAITFNDCDEVRWQFEQDKSVKGETSEDKFARVLMVYLDTNKDKDDN